MTFLQDLDDHLSAGSPPDVIPSLESTPQRGGGHA